MPGLYSWVVAPSTPTIIFGAKHHFFRVAAVFIQMMAQLMLGPEVTNATFTYYSSKCLCTWLPGLCTWRPNYLPGQNIPGEIDMIFKVYFKFMQAERH